MSSAEARALVVNGRSVPLAEIPAPERLLDTLRWRLGLKGTKEGCRSGGCGACTVLLGGRPLLACLALTHEIAGAPVTTVEAMEEDPVGRRVQEAFVREGAVQCGYCTPGFVVALTGLLRERPDADGEELLGELQGNLCRCTGYAAIVRAVRAVGGRR
jgi:aerobic carbon-monoxide dehydrogenase small subunit